MEPVSCWLWFLCDASGVICGLVSLDSSVPRVSKVIKGAGPSPPPRRAWATLWLTPQDGEEESLRRARGESPVEGVLMVPAVGTTVNLLPP